MSYQEVEIEKHHKSNNVAKKLDMQTHAILVLINASTTQIIIHFKINDMQMAEDTQLIVGHIVMQYSFQEQNMR